MNMEYAGAGVRFSECRYRHVLRGTGGRRRPTRRRLARGFDVRPSRRCASRPSLTVAITSWNHAMKRSQPTPAHLVATALLRNTERQKSCTWQVRAVLSGGITLGVELGAASVHWIPVLVGAMVLGLSVTAVCWVLAGYHLVRSFMVCPASSDGADASTPDGADPGHTPCGTPGHGP